MKQFKEYLKQYFVRAAQKPATFGVFIALIAFSLHFALFVAPYWPSEKGLHSFYQAMSFFLLYILIFVILHLVIVRTKITVFKFNEKEVILTNIDEDEPSIYQKPFWGKCFCQIIQLPDDQDWERPWDTDKCLILKIDFYVDVEGSTIIFPFLLSFKFNRQLNAKDWKYIIDRQDIGTNQSVYSLKKCLEHIFYHANMTEEKETRFKMLASICTTNNMKMRANALSEIEEMASFPDLFLGAKTKLMLLTLGVRNA
ncbi:MAG: hypothetical protein WCT50_02445 [Patescibacteria group bacterium]|jgi:hypothetical protein